MEKSDSEDETDTESESEHDREAKTAREVKRALKRSQERAQAEQLAAAVFPKLRGSWRTNSGLTLTVERNQVQWQTPEGQQRCVTLDVHENAVFFVGARLLTDWSSKKRVQRAEWDNGDEWTRCVTPPSVPSGDSEAAPPVAAGSRNTADVTDIALQLEGEDVTPEEMQEVTKRDGTDKEDFVKLPKVGEVYSVTADEDAARLAVASRHKLPRWRGRRSAMCGKEGKVEQIDLEDRTVRLRHTETVAIWWPAEILTFVHDKEKGRPCSCNCLRGWKTEDGKPMTVSRCVGKGVSRTWRFLLSKKVALVLACIIMVIFVALVLANSIKTQTHDPLMPPTGPVDTSTIEVYAPTAWTAPLHIEHLEG